MKPHQLLAAFFAAMPLTGLCAEPAPASQCSALVSQALVSGNAGAIGNLFTPAGSPSTRQQRSAQAATEVLLAEVGGVSGTTPLLSPPDGNTVKLDLAEMPDGYASAFSGDWLLLSTKRDGYLVVFLGSVPGHNPCALIKLSAHFPVSASERAMVIARKVDAALRIARLGS